MLKAARVPLIHNQRKPRKNSILRRLEQIISEKNPASKKSSGEEPPTNSS